MITVLLTTYNSAKYLHDSIRSILNQTFEDYEFLIIDDGSEDNTEEVVKSFSDDRIKYVKISHIGRSKALNYGLRKAKYDWIALMDADDISHPKRLEMQLKVLKDNPTIDWISNWYAVFYKNKIKYYLKLPQFSNKIRNDLILSNSVCFPSSIFRKQMLLEFGGFFGEVFEDYKLLLKIKNHCNFYNIQEVLYFQRKRKDSLSTENFEEKKNIHYKIQEPYYKDLKKEFGLKNDNEVYYYKGWREFLYGQRNKARYYWAKLGVKIVFYPKAFISFFLTFFAINYFFFLRKIGFKMTQFYRPWLLKRSKNKINISLIKNNTLKTITILGTKLSLVTENYLLKRVQDTIKIKKNINIIACDYRDIVQFNKMPIIIEEVLYYPDSSGIYILLHLFYKNAIKDFKRLVSTNFHYNVIKNASSNGYKLFFLGDTTATLKEFIKRIKKTFPNIKIVGFANGFEDLRSPTLVDIINNSRADILMIGLGIPKQSNWLSLNSSRLNPFVKITVGAFFTFYSGRVQRAPQIYSDFYLEWFYRLINEPKRLFPRYFIKFPQAFYLVAREKWKK